MDLSGVVLSVVGDVPVDSETPVVTSSVPAQSFRGAHRGRIYLCVFIRVSVRVC